jgi:hypothetical protein
MRTRAYPGPEVSHRRLRRAGWSCDLSGFTRRDGKVGYQIDAVKDGRRFSVMGATPAEALARALKAAES